MRNPKMDIWSYISKTDVMVLYEPKFVKHFVVLVLFLI